MAWTAIAKVDEVEERKAKIAQIKGKEIGVFRVGGEFFAVLNYCPHMGAPICQGKIFGAVMADEPGQQTYDDQRQVLRCPWHRWEFDLQTGAALAPIKQRIKTYPVQVQNGEILVDI